MKIAQLAILTTLFLSCGHCLAGNASTQSAALPTQLVLHDQRDQPVKPLDLRDGQRAVALIFISTDCPISNSYAPLIADLCHAFTPKAISFYTVYEDTSLTPAAATTHHDAYRLPCDGLLDSQQQLAHLASATVTPEAVIVGPNGAVLYRGRIDDQFAAIGHKRFAATTHELKDALEQIAGDHPVTVAAASAVGCAIP